MDNNRKLTNSGISRDKTLNKRKVSRQTIGRIAKKNGLNSRIARNTFALND